MRPDVGTQAQFKKKKPPHTYRYDPSLSPALEWDESSAREVGEARLAELREQLAALKQKRAGAGCPAQVPVEAIDERENELMVLKHPKDAG